MKIQLIVLNTIILVAENTLAQTSLTMRCPIGQARTSCPPTESTCSRLIAMPRTGTDGTTNSIKVVTACTDKNTCPTEFPINIGVDNWCASCPISKPYYYNLDCVASCPSDNPLIFDQKCVANCPSGTFKSGNNCVASCPFGQFIHGNTCVGSCPVGMFINGATCVSSCPVGMFSRGDRCVITCFSREFVYGKICLSDCTSNNLFRLGESRTCVESCPADSPLVSFEKTCVKSCPSDAPLISLERNCVQSCPSGQYQSDNNCVTDCNAIGKVVEDGKCVFKDQTLKSDTSKK